MRRRLGFLIYLCVVQHLHRFRPFLTPPCHIVPIGTSRQFHGRAALEHKTGKALEHDSEPIFVALCVFANQILRGDAQTSSKFGARLGHLCRAAGHSTDRGLRVAQNWERFRGGIAVKGRKERQKCLMLESWPSRSGRLGSPRCVRARARHSSVGSGVIELRRDPYGPATSCKLRPAQYIVSAAAMTFHSQQFSGTTACGSPVSPVLP